MKKVTLALILVFFLSGCASKPYGTSDPQDAIEQCAELSGIREKVRQYKKDASESGQSIEQTMAPKFDRDGHISATVVIARIAGLSPERQYALSYYSNYPDIDSTYIAWKVSVYNTFLPWNWSWLCESNDTLHALHGGNDDEIKERREKLTSALKYTLQSDKFDWISGILMHALADTFAHTKQGYSIENEEAYGCYWGHVWDTP